MMSKDVERLQNQAALWWKAAKAGRILKQDEKDMMHTAYITGCLPHDPDYSVAQWVEDDCPPLP